MAWVVKMPKIYFKMLNNPSLLKDILFLLYKHASGGGPIHARVPIQAHPQFS